MSIWSPSSFNQDKFMQDVDDRVSMICMKKVLKNPESLNQDVFDKVISCKNNFFNIFAMMAPALSKADIKPTASGNQESAAPEEES